MGAPAFFAARRYAFVIQDVRGHFKSEGEFVPFLDDAWGANRDGLDTVEWVAGHCIRVAVTSSSFPRYDRNLNTGGLAAAETARQVAVHTIFHDSLRMSRIILPVVD